MFVKESAVPKLLSAMESTLCFSKSTTNAIFLRKRDSCFAVYSV